MIREPIVQSMILLAAAMPSNPFKYEPRFASGGIVTGIDFSNIKEESMHGLTHIVVGCGMVGKTNLIANLAMKHNIKIVCINPETIPSFPIKEQFREPFHIARLPMLENPITFEEEAKKQHKFIQNDSGGNIAKPGSKEFRKQKNNYNKNAHKKKRRK